MRVVVLDAASKNLDKLSMLWAKRQSPSCLNDDSRRNPCPTSMICVVVDFEDDLLTQPISPYHAAAIKSRLSIKEWSPCETCSRDGHESNDSIFGCSQMLCGE